MAHWIFWLNRKQLNFKIDCFNPGKKEYYFIYLTINLVIFYKGWIYEVTITGTEYKRFYSHIEIK